MKLKAIGLILSSFLVCTLSTHSYAETKDDVVKRGTLKCGVSSDKMRFLISTTTENGLGWMLIFAVLLQLLF